ncbi:MAG: hypothetical protein ATN36_07740 [Epulopiscium sp. Nele67-Bin005]|nr:MAG: hypothetical protein ATN36_07740 [Epulopiscium sp. Nele67-Bin005]
MDILKKTIPYLIVMLISLYCVPFFITANTSSIMTVLLLLNPMLCFMNSDLYDTKKSFHMLLSIFISLLIVQVYLTYSLLSANLI